MVSQYISQPGIDSYWPCETVQYESEEERELFALRSFLHLSEIVQVVEERRISRLNYFLFLTALSISPLTCQFFSPPFHFIYITNFSTFQIVPSVFLCTFPLFIQTDLLQYLLSLFCRPSSMISTYRNTQRTLRR